MAMARQERPQDPHFADWLRAGTEAVTADTVPVPATASAQIASWLSTHLRKDRAVTFQNKKSNLKILLKDDVQIKAII